MPESLGSLMALVNKGVSVTEPLRPLLQSSVVLPTLPAIPTFGSALPVNASRWAICFFPQTAGAQTGYRPVGPTYTSVQQAIWIQPGSTPTILTREDIGDLVTQAWEGTGGNPVLIIESNAL